MSGSKTLFYTTKEKQKIINDKVIDLISNSDTLNPYIETINNDIEVKSEEELNLNKECEEKIEFRDSELDLFKSNIEFMINNYLYNPNNPLANPNLEPNIPPATEREITIEYIKSMFFDELQNKLFVCTYGHGLAVKNDSNDKFKFHSFDIGLNSPYINKIIRIDNPFLYVVATDNGLAFSDNGCLTFTMRMTKDGLTSYKCNDVIAIPRLNNNPFILVATDNGLCYSATNCANFSKFDDSKNTFSGKKITSVIHKNGMLYIAVYGVGLYKIELDNFNSTEAILVKPLEITFGKRCINKLAYYNNVNKILVCTDEGVGITEDDFTNIIFITKNNGLSSNKVYDAVCVGDKLFVSTNLGVCKINKNSDVIDIIDTNNGLTNNICTSIVSYMENIITIGHSKGITLSVSINYNDDEELENSFIFTNLILINNNIYNATNNGVVVYDQSGSVLKTITTANGLGSNKCFCVEYDYDDSKLYILTESGVYSSQDFGDTCSLEDSIVYTNISLGE